MAHAHWLAVLLAMAYAAAVMIPVLMLYHEKCVNTHAILSTIGTGLIGLGMLSYRLLRGQKTRYVKFLHLTINVTAVVLIIYGIVVAVRAGAQELQIMHHRYPASAVIGVVLLHIIVAAGVFLSIKQMHIRLTFAPLHDIFGIWLFLCLAGCCIAGSYPIVEFEEPVWILVYYSALFISFILVMAVVLSPFFEWELVGLL